MWKGVLVLLGALTGFSAGAEVVYLKRSEVWAYEFGKQAGQLAGQYQEFQGYLAERDRDWRRVDELKRRASACGNCPERGRLQVEAEQLESSLSAQDQLMCGAFDMAKQIGPSGAAVEKLMGMAPICQKVQAEREQEIDRQAKAKAVQRIKAGDLKAYSDWGIYVFTNMPYLSFSERMSQGCPWLYQGAIKGDVDSITQLAYRCLNGLAAEEDRRVGLKLLQACVDRGEPRCMSQMAWFHSPIRDSNWPPPLPVNEAEALRLFDRAASLGHAASAKEAAILRRKQERESRAAAGLPPLPQEPLPGAPRPWPVKEGVYAVKSPGGGRQGTCTIRALGNDRYELAWNDGRVATATVRGSGLYLDNAPAQTRYAILNTSRMALLSSPQESLTLMQ